MLTGLSINFSKSQLFDVQGQDAEMQEWASILGCQVGSVSFVYLGETVGQAMMNLIEVFNTNDG